MSKNNANFAQITNIINQHTNFSNIFYSSIAISNLSCFIPWTQAEIFYGIRYWQYHLAYGQYFDVLFGGDDFFFRI